MQLQLERLTDSLANRTCGTSTARQPPTSTMHGNKILSAVRRRLGCVVEELVVMPSVYRPPVVKTNPTLGSSDQPLQRVHQ
jgi:hypothetical protein